MSEKDRKREAAMRLFGALSGVDEEYLADCEADAGGATAGQKPVPFERLGLFMRKYGTAVAAVLCVAVLGISLTGYRLGGRKTADSTKNGGMAFLQENTACADMEQGYEDAAEEMREASQDTVNSMTETSGTTANDGSSDSGSGNDSNDSIIDNSASRETTQDGLQEERAETVSKEKLQVEKEEASGEKLKDNSQRMEAEQNLYANKKLTLEEARQVSVVGAYLPAVFPESGGIDALTAIDGEGQERIRLGWNTDKRDASEGWFYLTIENLGNSLPDWLEYSTVFDEEQVTKTDVEQCMAAKPAGAANSGAPEGTLNVLYENQGSYVLLTIWGEISSEEVWEMLDSVKK